MKGEKCLILCVFGSVVPPNIDRCAINSIIVLCVGVSKSLPVHYFHKVQKPCFNYPPYSYS